jgi:F0F1-type ATP synthase assembly protein I
LGEKNSLSEKSKDEEKDGEKSKDEEKDGEKSKDEEKDGEKSKDEEKDGDKKALKLSFLEISLIVGICILLLFLLVMVFRRRR